MNTNNPLLEHLSVEQWKDEYTKMLDADPHLTGKLCLNSNREIVIPARSQNEAQTKPLFSFTQALKEVGLL